MLSIDQIQGLKAYLPPEEKRRIKRDGTERKPKRLGKVHAAVFAPGGKRVVGFMVKRPDLAGMVKRPDLFLGLDSFRLAEGGLLCTRGDDSFDDAARARLHVGDWDACIIWGGMDVKTEDGRELGYVTDVSFSEKTGTVSAFDVSDGTMSTQLVGVVRIPRKLLVGYEKGWMVVKTEAKDLKLTGGLAEKAGTASAKAKIEGKKAGKKAAKATSEAVDKGSYQLGRAIGKAKRAVADAQKPSEPQLPPKAAEEVRVTRPNAGELPNPEADMKKRSYAPKNVAKSTKTVNNVSAKEHRSKKPSTKKNGASSDAARALGKQLGKTKGMFEDFKREFDENSR